METKKFLTNIYKNLYGEWFSGCNVSSLQSTDITYVPFDMKETDTTYDFSIHFPGLESQDITVYTEGLELHILIDKNDEFYYYSEIDDVSSYRLIVLPENSSLYDIESTHKNGVLYLKVKKCSNMYQRNIVFQS